MDVISFDGHRARGRPGQSEIELGIGVMRVCRLRHIERCGQLCGRVASTMALGQGYEWLDIG